jgi:acetyltransferase-like isoleucine patch superfamily enzyme
MPRKLRLALKVLRSPLDLLVVYLPGPGGELVRARYYRGRLRHLGADVRIEVGVHFVNPEHISIGDNCWIDKYVIMLAGPPVANGRLIARIPSELFAGREGEIVIADNCHIASHALINGHGGVHVVNNSTVAAGAKIISLSHHHRNPTDPSDDRLYSFGSRTPADQQSLVSAAVVMEDETALGTNAVMLPGTSIGAWSWVGAQSVVTKPIPSRCIALGAPAKVVGTRGDASPAPSDSSPHG